MRLPKIMVADDLRELLDGIETSARTLLSAAAEVKTWFPDQGSLIDCLNRLRQDGWSADLLVLDINMGEGGKHGLEYLRDLRDRTKARGFLALPVVLATGNEKRDVDQDRLTPAVAGRSQGNATGIAPSQWLDNAKDFEPEALLYGKTGDANFLRRVLESLPIWQQTARRRAWNALLAEVAGLLDEAEPDPVKIGTFIAEFARTELEACDVFVRWRAHAGLYRLIGCETTIEPYSAIGELLNPEEIPLLGALVAGKRKPVLKARVSSDEAGSLRARLAGKQLLAASAILDGRTVGYMTMFRQPDATPFDLHIDAGPLGLLARLLASALGRAEALRLDQERDKELLEFAGVVANADSDHSVAQALADVVHKTIHGGDSQTGEVTVRLVNFSTGGIERRAHAGIQTENVPIWLWSSNSVIQRVIKSAEPERHDDIQTPEARKRCLDTGMTPGQLHAEVCVPLKSGLGALGAVNAENTRIARYRDEHQQFMESAGALAAAALERIRAGDFLEGVANFASLFSDLDAAGLHKQLLDLVVRFSGASAVVRMTAPVDASPVQPWEIESADVLLHDGNPILLRDHLKSLYQQQWDETTLKKWIAARVWRDADCQFEAKSPVKVNLRGYASRTANDPAGIEEAMAVVWLRAAGTNEPRACLLLLWFFRPWMSMHDIDLLGKFGTLLTALESRQAELKTWMSTAVEGEQAAALGHVFQHFRHRLQSDLGSLKGLAQRMDFALEDATGQELPAKVHELHERIEKLGESFQKSLAYIKSPDPDWFTPKSLHANVLNDLQATLSALDLVDLVAVNDIAWGDADIYELALFTLLHNAADALSEHADKRIVVRSQTNASFTSVIVEDSGPGIGAENCEKLFKFGFTTKRDGLGSALAFARLRLRLFRADLLLATPVYLSGAAFEIRLPVKNHAEPGLSTGNRRYTDASK